MLCMSNPPLSPLRRLQVVGISVVGAVAALAFLVSLALVGAAADALRVVAYVAAGLCALIGVSFAIPGGGR